MNRYRRVRDVAQVTRTISSSIFMTFETLGWFCRQIGNAATLRSMMAPRSVRFDVCSQKSSNVDRSLDG
jgi:hypothetical protein